MDQLRVVFTAAAAAAVFGGSLLAVLPRSDARSSASLADSATPVAIVDQAQVAGLEQAQVADLQTRVADLTTRVAELGGAEDEALAGRLGGSRTGFDAQYGAPVAYLGGGVVQYEVQGLGRLTVSFEDDVARRLSLVSPRPATLPLEQPDAADWSPERAREIAATLAPRDADFAETEAAELAELAGQSEVLAQAAAAVDEEGCAPAGPVGFTVSYTQPSPDLVSEISLAIDEGGAALAPTEPERGGRVDRGASAVATTSLGGVTAVNGLLLQAFDVVDGAEGERLPAPGQKLVAVELAIENEARRSVRFDLADFVLVDASGQEVTAICGGVEPALGRVEVGRGEAVEGWVTFQVPEGFEPERFVVLAPAARVAFMLN